MKFNRQHLLSHHLLEGLTARFQAMAFQTVTKDLVKKHPTGRAGQDGGTRVRIGHRGITQRQQAFDHVPCIRDHPIIIR